MYAVSCSAAGVCLIINSKCCSLQIKASGFNTKHSALISPKQVSVRYRFSFTSPHPPHRPFPPCLPLSPHPRLTSVRLPLILSLLRRERARWKGGGAEGGEAEKQKRNRRGRGGGGGGCREARSKLKTCFSIKTTASRTE